MVDFTLGLSALTQGLAIIRELNKIDRQLDVADLKLRVAELSTSLASAQIVLAEAQTELAARDMTIASLRENFAALGESIEHNGFRYPKGPDGTPAGMPYCPRCLSADGFAIRLVAKAGAPAIQSCPQCKRDYRVKVFRHFSELNVDN